MIFLTLMSHKKKKKVKSEEHISVTRIVSLVHAELKKSKDKAVVPVRM